MLEEVSVVAIAVLLTAPANWLIRLLLVHIRAVDTGGSEGAGRWIGILERLIIFLLVLSGEADAAALVVAAKAILRFPEITGDEPHLSAEYVLIGSLISWLLAIAGGFGARSILMAA
ncbi:MAG TPA: hypothetical protein VHL52_05695 [Acidimicrobiia bacterium]|nr:hypothetical protein [Acidimicrobiia bacterium]